MLQDIQALLEQATLRQPILICLDDLQWADSGTRAAIRTLPTRLAGLAAYQAAGSLQDLVDRVLDALNERTLNLEVPGGQLDILAADAHGPGGQVKVRSPQRDCLSPPQAGDGADQDQGAIPAVLHPVRRIRCCCAMPGPALPAPGFAPRVPARRAALVQHRSGLADHNGHSAGPLRAGRGRLPRLSIVQLAATASMAALTGRREENPRSIAA
jgi:hypothetical protein